MAIEVTERWSDRKLTRDIELGRWTAARGFDVAYATNPIEACDAVEGNGGAVRGQSHPQCAFLICTSINADCISPNLYKATALYTIPTGGGAPPTSEDPLMQPAKIGWDCSLSSADLERTPGGVLVANANSQPFDPSPNRDMQGATLTIVRNQPFYDPAAAMRVINRLNRDSFVVKGKGFNAAVAPGQGRILEYRPSGAYDATAAYVSVGFRIEFKPDQRSDGSGNYRGFSDAWDEVRMNKGTVAYYHDETDGNYKLGYLYRGMDPVTNAVFLDKRGMPIDGQGGGTYTVTQMHLPVEPAPSVLQDGPDFHWEAVSAPSLPGGIAYAMHFRKYDLINFLGLI